MRICCLQHVPFETPAYLEIWAEKRDQPLRAVKLYFNEQLPHIEEFDVLVVLGGPMSANDEAQLPWLVKEKQLISAAIAAKKKVLGICLGAQLIASACGKRVFRNKQHEIGWHDISLPEAAKSSCLRHLPEDCTVLHWHGETFDLPEGAALLASSKACQNQAFALGDNVLGLQFHLEMTDEAIEAMLENCAGDLKPGEFVQNAAEIRAGKVNLNALQSTLDAVLDDFCFGSRKS